MTKKFYVIFVILLHGITSNSFAQWTTSGTDIYNSNSGNVGIGTTAPQSKLHLNGNFTLNNGNEIFFNDNGQIRSLDSNHRILFRRSENIMELREFGSIVFSPGSSNGTATAKVNITAQGFLGIGTANPTEALEVNGAALFTTGNGGTFGLGAIGQVNRIQTAYSSGPSIRFLNTGDSYANLGFGGLSVGSTYATVSAPVDGAIIQGPVGIGTTDTKGYQLAVNGNAIFTAVKIKPFANWPDYVFHSGYHLPSLSELEQYILRYNHLPEVPSEAEVKKDGLDLGENQATLLKKIEELTLYVIDLKKEIEQLQAERH
jgi:hypothetical protein